MTKPTAEQMTKDLKKLVEKSINRLRDLGWTDEEIVPHLPMIADDAMRCLLIKLEKQSKGL